MSNLQELIEERQEIYRRQKEIHTLAGAENRNLTAGEKVEWDDLNAEFNTLDGKISAFKETQQRESNHLTACVGEYGHDSRGNPTFTPENYETRQTKGLINMTDQNKTEYRFNPEGTEIRDAYNRYILSGANALTAKEYRALQADLDTSGGFLTVPLEVAKEVIQALDNEVFIRRLARTFPVPHAESFGAPDLDPDFGDPTWTAELSTGTDDETLGFHRRDLTPTPVARRIKVSNKLLRMSQLNPEAIVRERMVYKVGTVQENAFLNGTDANQPLGVFTVSDLGIGTDRDSATNNTATSVKSDGIISAVGKLKSQYRKRAVWIAHRDFETRIRKLKTGDGDYIWRAGLEGNPSTLMGFPLHLSEYAPHVFEADQYVAILGDFHFYWIVDAMNIQIQRLVELFSATNQTGFIVRAEADGAPILAEAFVRLQMGS